MEPLDLSSMTDEEWRAYRAGRKEKQIAKDRLEGAMPNEPPVSSDLMFTVGPDGMPYFLAGEAFFNAEGDMTDLPPKPPSRVEQALKLNMMTAEARGVWPEDPNAPRAQTTVMPPVAEGMPKAGEDMVSLPAHYARYAIEPIRFIGENKLDWFQGNIIKYVTRWDAKNGVQDIRKVRRYAQMYELYILGDPDWWKAGKPEDFKV